MRSTRTRKPCGASNTIFAVRLDSEIVGPGRSTLPDLDQHAGRRRNIHVFRFEVGRVGNADCAANQDWLMAQLRSDQAGDCSEAADECPSKRGSDDDGLRHALEVGGDRDCEN